jgi:hypothetical protein
MSLSLATKGILGNPTGMGMPSKGVVSLFYFVGEQPIAVDYNFTFRSKSPNLIFTDHKNDIAFVSKPFDPYKVSFTSKSNNLHLIAKKFEGSFKSKTLNMEFNSKFPDVQFETVDGEIVMYGIWKDNDLIIVSTSPDMEISTNSTDVEVKGRTQ